MMSGNCGRSVLLAAVLLCTFLVRAGGMGAAESVDFGRVPLPREVPEERAVLKVSSEAGFTSPTVFDLDGLMAFPRTEFTATDPWDGATYRYLLAYRLDGTLLRDHPDRKRRGSLMIAIDFHSNPGLDPSVVKAQLVWQVTAIALE
ncbi:MAG TPA: hypothetical protein VLH81_03035 [Desulfobacterales bacterium]|nr:hypothetical protein [Desulfobacterales bacterium]